MIAPDKLNHLKGGQKRRKLALCFGALERDIAGIAESGVERGRTVSAGCAGGRKSGDDWLYAGAEFERTAADAARDDGADAH